MYTVAIRGLYLFNLCQFVFLGVIAVDQEGTSHRTRVYEWETGKRQPPLTSLLAFDQLVGISTNDLIDDRINLKLSNS